MQTRRRVWVSAGVVIISLIMSNLAMDSEVLKWYSVNGYSIREMLRRANNWKLRAYICAHFEHLQKMIAQWHRLNRREGQPGGAT